MAQKNEETDGKQQTKLDQSLTQQDLPPSDSHQPPPNELLHQTNLLLDSASTQVQIQNSLPNPLDPTIVEAMTTGTIRDKQILLLAESEMGRFVSSNIQRQPLSSSFSTSLNSYQRMLVHRLGDSFGIKRSVESNQIIIEKTPTSTWPHVRLESLIVRQDASPSNAEVNPASINSLVASSISTHSSDKIEPSSSSSSSCFNPNPSTCQPKTFKIMSRTLSQSSRPTNRNLMPSTASSSSSTDGSPSESRRNDMSYEERQAAYLEARNRIFANSNHSSTENSTGESTAGSTSSSGAGPEEDCLSVTTSNSKSKSQSESLSTESGIGNESSNSMTNLKDRSDSIRSSKPPAKLRPSATSFDPNAKAHGYEEVTIIEVDNQSITVPYQTTNSLYSNYHAHPTTEYPNSFPSDPRLTHVPNHPFKNCPHPSYPFTSSVPPHPTYPGPSYHTSGMPPPSSIHMAQPGVMTPPPFIQPSHQASGELNSPTMATVMSTLPPPSIPQIQPSNNNMFPPDHKFCPDNIQPTVFSGSRTHESGHNATPHTMRSHRNHPSVSDSSLHQRPGPIPSPFPSPLPPPPQHHLQLQQQQHHHQQIPFSGPPSNGFVTDYKNFNPPHLPPHEAQPQHYPNPSMGGRYSRDGAPYMDTGNHSTPPNGFSTWSSPLNASNPPLSSSSPHHFHSTLPSQDHHRFENSGANSSLGVQNGNGTSDHPTAFINGDPTSSKMAMTGPSAPTHQSNCRSSLSSSSCSTTGNSSSCSLNSPTTTARLNHQQDGLHANQAPINIGILNKSISRLKFNHHPGHTHNNRKSQGGNENQIKHPRAHDQNGKERHSADHSHYRSPSNSDSVNPIQNQSHSLGLLHHPLPPKPVWNLKHPQNQQQLGASNVPESNMSTNNNGNNINMIF